MQLQQAVNNVFVQLSGSLEKLSPDQYARPCSHLNHSTIGQHVRHIIEMFQCLEKGYVSGCVNYENRKRDKLIETDKVMAGNLLRDIYDRLNKPDKALVLEGAYNDDSTEILQFPTNYYREVVYNLEHTIHHMALIRIGIGEVSGLQLPETYGLASSTIKHNQSCVR